MKCMNPFFPFVMEENVLHPYITYSLMYLKLSHCYEVYLPTVQVFVHCLIIIANNLVPSAMYGFVPNKHFHEYCGILLCAGESFN
jgi:hypothetical protein